MADTLKFRGLSTVEIDTSSVAQREIVLDTELNQVVFGNDNTTIRFYNTTQVDALLAGAGSGGGDTGGSGGTSIAVSENPPANPSEGDLWWDPTNGNTYIYYVDVDSAQWVESSSSIGFLEGSQISGNSIGDLSDVTVTAPVAGEVLRYDGSEWIDSSLDYADLVGTPSFAAVATSGQYSDLVGQPSFATVATTGSYTDLLNVPSFANYITSGQVNPVYFASQASFPSAATVHGAVAHSHSDGAMYFAHGGVWNKLANDADLGAYAPVNDPTFTGTVTLPGDPTTALEAATKQYVDNNSGGGGGASVSVSPSAPSTPSEGDLWWDSDNAILYVYYNDGASDQWVEAAPAATSGGTVIGGGGGASVSVSATAPTSPADGDLWWDTDSVSLYVYHDDGTSAQWIETSASAGPASVSVSPVPPSNPSEGDLWWDRDGVSLYVYYSDGTSSQWVETNSRSGNTTINGGGGSGGASVSVSETAPTSPSDGDLWFDSSTGISYIYYNDGSSSQWVESINATPTGGTGGTGGGASVSASETAPTSPTEGDLWYDTTNGKTYMYYADGSSSQWIETAGTYDAYSEWERTTGGTGGNINYAGGNVGINSSSPTNHLQVGGNVGASNYFIGTGADTNSAGTFGLPNVGGYIQTWGNDTVLDGAIIFGTAEGGVNEVARFNQYGLNFDRNNSEANSLDDFEEGTWVPTLSSDSPGSGVWVPDSGNGGFYTKIGKKVFIQFNLRGTYTRGTASGSIQIVNLPFLVAGIGDRPGNSAYGAITMPYIAGFDVTAGLIITGGLCLPGTNGMHVYAQNNTTTYNVGIETAAQTLVGVNVHAAGEYEVA